MNRWLMLALLLFLLGASCAYADVPGFGPRPPRLMPVHPSNAVPIVIQAGTDGEPARLLLPRSLLGRAKKATPGERFGSLSIPIPIVAVLMLSAGGLSLLCLRSHRFTRSLLIFFTLVAVAGVSTSMLWANMPPPSYEIAMLKANGGKGWKLDDVRVEITEDGDTIRLIVPQSIILEKMPAPKDQHSK